MKRPEKITCPHCGGALTGEALEEIKRELFARYSGMRKKASGGRHGGRPRKVQHDPDNPRCLCVDCRKARGQYPTREKKAGD